MLLTQEENAIYSLYALVKAVKAKVTKQTLKETLLNQPEYPSLFALSQALETWKIENAALRIPAEQLAEVPTPFLAFLKIDGGSYGLVQNITQDAIEWQHDKKGLQREKLADFAKNYKGTILVAETNEASGESNYTENRNKELLNGLRLTFVLVSVLVLMISGFYFSFGSSAAWQVYVLASVKVLGVIVSFLLLWYQVDKNNAFVKNLCQVGKKTNCETILHSKAANLFSWLSWSEIGFFYFTGTLLALFTNIQVIPLLSLLTLLALPYTLYSLYYQIFVARQYCTLCLTVMGLLWVELALAPIPLPLSPTGKGELLKLGLCLLIPITFWTFIKPFFIKSLQVEPLKTELRKFKNNPELFERLLTSQPQMPMIPYHLETIIIGDKNAENTLTMITNPFCPPCARAHEEIEKLIASKATLNCQVIFTATNEETDKRGEVARHLLSLVKDQRAEALHAWYLADKKDIKQWKAKFKNVQIDEQTAEEIVAQHNAWCDMAQVTATPTLYLNGYQLPQVYQLADLPYLIHSDLAKSTY
jgi:uncharacterized membrane protein/glutaredoxin